MPNLPTISLTAAVAGAVCAGCGHGAGTQSRQATVSRGEDGLLRDFSTPAQGPAQQPSLNERPAVAPSIAPARSAAWDPGPQSGTTYQTRYEQGVKVIEIRPAGASQEHLAGDGYAEEPPMRVYTDGVPPEPSVLAAASTGYSTLSLQVVGAGDCWVLVAGRSRGQAPLYDLEVDAGPLTVEIDCAQRKRAVRRLNLAAGEHHEMTVELTAKKGKRAKKAKKAKRKKRRQRR